MNIERREKLAALLGSDPDVPKELSELVAHDVHKIAEVIDEWLIAERDYFFIWAEHARHCPFYGQKTIAVYECTCGLTKAITNRKKP